MAMPRSCRADEAVIVPAVRGPSAGRCRPAAYRITASSEPPDGMARDQLGPIGDAHAPPASREKYEHHFFAFLTRSSTTDGSARVEMSPRLLSVAFGDLAQDAAHDLAGAGLGQAGRELDHIRLGDGTDLMADEFLAVRPLSASLAVDARLQGDIGIDALALDVVGIADHRGFGHLDDCPPGRFPLRRCPGGGPRH